MGHPVTVDSDDLETILFAAGALKNVEAAIIVAKADEQFRSSQGKIGDAVQRIGNAWRGAARRRQFPDRYEPAKTGEREMLRGLAKAGASAPFGIEVEDPSKYRGMVARGWAETGVHEQCVTWTNGSGAKTIGTSPRARLRITDYAMEQIGGVLTLWDEVPEETETFLDRFKAWVRSKGAGDGY